MVALMTVATASFAQEDNNRGNRQRGQRMDPTEMVKRRTETMVERYKLNAEQADSLRALNERTFAAFGQRGQGRPEGGNEGMRQRRNGNGAQGRPNGMGQRRDNSAYTEGLKKIFTEEQFKAYQEDMKNMPQRGGFGQRGGQRRERNTNTDMN